MTPTAEHVLDEAQLVDMVTRLADLLDRYRLDLNRLNVYPVPDGDTGDNLVATIATITGRLRQSADRAAAVDAIATGALLGGRGSSGVILGQALRGFVTTLAEPCDAGGLAAGLEAAAQSARRAVADPVEGTILTVADDAARVAVSVGEGSDASAGEVARAAAEEGRASLARTPTLLPELERAGVVDAGGLGYVLFLDALTEVITGRASPPLHLTSFPSGGDGPPAPVDASRDGSSPSVAPPGPRFEVLCLLDADADRVETLRRRWRTLGDTVAIGGAGTTWRAHVHTDDVAGALAAAEETGQVSDVEITDLSEQLAGEAGLRPADPTGGRPAVVAVAEGAGLVAAYLEAGVQRVVIGGITAKPATGQLVRVIEACAGPVVLLCGDKDVVPAAHRAAEVARVGTRVVAADMVAGLLALEDVGPRPPGDAATLAERVRRRAEDMRVVRVQRAVRDAETGVGPVHEGDWLAMARHGPVAIGGTAEDAVLLAAAELVAPGANFGWLTWDQEGAGTAAVLAALRRAHPALAWQARRTDRPSCAYGLVVA